MAAHRRRRDPQAARDLDRAGAAREQFEHPELAHSQGCQPGSQVAGPSGGQAPGTELRDQAGDQRASNRGLTPRDRVQGGAKRIGVDVLEQISHRPRIQSGEQLAFVRSRGEHDDCDIGCPHMDPRRRTDATVG